MHKQIILLLFIGICVGCSTTKPEINKEVYNQSHYHIQRYSQEVATDSAIVIGQIFNMMGNNIKCFFIQGPNQKVDSECNGQIKFTLAPDTYHFTGYMVGYDSVRTNKFFIGAGDSIRINFYLEQDISLHKQ